MFLIHVTIVFRITERITHKIINIITERHLDIILSKSFVLQMRKQGPKLLGYLAMLCHKWQSRGQNLKFLISMPSINFSSGLDQVRLFRIIQKSFQGTDLLATLSDVLIQRKIRKGPRNLYLQLPEYFVAQSTMRQAVKKQIQLFLNIEIKIKIYFQTFRLAAALLIGSPKKMSQKLTFPTGILVFVL